MARTATVQISREALLHNFQRAKDEASGGLVMAVVKANAYGHGAALVAGILDQADGFAVARLEEALELREAGIKQPILLLEGALEEADLEIIAQHHLHTVVHSLYQIEQFESVRLRHAVPVWLKIDTGMRRLGVPPAQVRSLSQRLEACASVAKPLRLMTHLATADEQGNLRTADQLRTFSAAIEGLPGERSIANSAGILGWLESHTDWVRPGIMLYGASPFVGRSGPQDDLRPVMQFDSRLIAVNPRRKGDRVGYGGYGVCPADMPVGVAAVGYGDGYPRHARQGTPVLVNGKRCSLLGRVSMDMITIDLRNAEDAAIGDQVRLWGEGLSANEVADWSDTIAYELFCGITGRVRRISF
ncbi:MAG TPA: alanine racemase [Gammaproteobacteria bacterium]